MHCVASTVKQALQLAGNSLEQHTAKILLFSENSYNTSIQLHMILLLFADRAPPLGTGASLCFSAVAAARSSAVTGCGPVRPLVSPTSGFSSACN